MDDWPDGLSGNLQGCRTAYRLDRKSFNHHLHKLKKNEKITGKTCSEAKNWESVPYNMHITETCTIYKDIPNRERERERGGGGKGREKTRDEKRGGINPKLQLTSQESNSAFKELPLMYESGISSLYPSANAKIAGRAAVLSSK